MKISKLEQLLFDVTSISTSEVAGEELANASINTIGTALLCEWGSYWRVDSLNRSLDSLATWNTKGVHVQKLELRPKGRSRSLSDGNAGHVWSTRKPIWNTNIVKDICIPRSIDAKESGLSGGIWFALKTDLIL